MGRFPRKCKLRGPSGITSGVTSGYPPGTLYISPGPNLENPAKIWHFLTSEKNPAKFGQKLAKFVKISGNLAKKIAKFSVIFDENFEH